MRSRKLILSKEMGIALLQNTKAMVMANFSFKKRSIELPKMT